MNACLIADWNIVSMPLPPRVTSITPNIGLSLTASSGGPHVRTIIGSNFQPNAQVTIGGVAANNVNFVNSTTLTCTVGTLATAGQKNVTVTNPTDGQSHTLVNGYRAMASSLWLDSEVGVTNTGVFTWADQSGNGNSAVQGDPPKQPTTLPSDAIFGGKPCVILDAVDDFLAGSIAFNSNNFAVYVVACATNATAGNQGVFGLIGAGATGDNSSSSSVIHYRGGTSINTFRSPANLCTAAGPIENVAFGLASRFDGANHNLRINGATATPVASTGSANVGSFTIGCRYLSNVFQLFFPGKYASIIVLPTNPTTQEDIEIRAFLTARFGIVAF